MREIKFRGKCFMTGKWRYGDLIEDGGMCAIVTDARIYGQDSPWVKRVYEVDTETVGQLTNLKDKNGRGIYEGDVLAPKHSSSKGVYKVVWHDNGFMIEFTFTSKYQGEEYEGKSYLPIYADSYNVIGNIYENPELLEGME